MPGALASIMPIVLALLGWAACVLVLAVSAVLAPATLHAKLPTHRDLFGRTATRVRLRKRSFA